jgi:ferredoxin-NADP reductase
VKEAQKGRRQPHPFMNWNAAVRLVARLGLTWTAVFLLGGGTAAGKAWFTTVAATAFANPKAGVPLVVLAWPLLFSATLAAAVWRRPDEHDVVHRLPPSCLSLLPLPWLAQRCRHPLHLGDPVVWRRRLLLWLPFWVYTLTSIRRKLAAAQDDDTSTDWKVMKVANVFGMVGLLALGLLLLPVTTHSPLMRVLGVSPATALAWHQATGRLVVLASLTHGALHTYRWTGLAGEGFWAMILPPVACWRPDATFSPTCVSVETDCTCYDIGKNLAGVVAGVALLCIALTSWTPYVRRHMYWLFYRVHMLAAPLVFAGVVLHWNRSVLYLAGGLLYYLALYVPTRLETQDLCVSPSSRGGVALVSAERIAPPTNAAEPAAAASFLSLTFHAQGPTVDLYCPTQFVKVRVPALSSRSHPFTMNRVPGERQQLRLIIRENGPFTRGLARRCRDDASQPPPPAIHLDGFFGSHTRVRDLLQHDIVVLVAGGIGITTYLTLVGDAVEAAKAYPSHSRRLQKLYLHWICREKHLVDYVEQHYFDKLASLADSTASLQLNLVVHITGKPGTTTRAHPIRATDIENHHRLGHQPVDDGNADEEAPGRMFRSSRYNIGSSHSYATNLPVFAAYFLMTSLGLSLIWNLYTNVQTDDAILARGWTLLCVLLLGAGVGSLVHLFVWKCGHRITPTGAEFAPIRIDDEVEMENISAGHTTMSAGGIQRAEHHRAFSHDERQGRPSMHSLLNPLEEAKYPAVFSCGPGSLMQDLRKTTSGRCRMRLQRWVCGEPRIALYEEAFEM